MTAWDSVWVAVENIPAAPGRLLSAQRLNFRDGCFMLRNANVVGSIVARFRFQQGWTRKVMATRLQLIGCNITEQIIANIELKRCGVTDTQLIRIAAVFGIYLVDLFPEKWRHCILLKEHVRDCPGRRFCKERRPSKSRRSRRSKKK